MNTAKDKIIKAKCRVCGVVLDNSNCYPSNIQSNIKLCKKCCCEKSKKWSKNNKAKVNLYAKRKRDKNPEKYRENQREHYKNNLEKERAYRKKYRDNNLKDIDRKRKEIYANYNKEIDDIFGTQCYICKRNSYLALHQKEGKKHPHNKPYLIKNRTDFVRLCRYCHSGVHFCMDKLGFDWEKINKLMEEYNG